MNLKILGLLLFLVSIPSWAALVDEIQEGDYEIQKSWSYDDEGKAHLDKIGLFVSKSIVIRRAAGVVSLKFPSGPHFCDGHDCLQLLVPKSWENKFWVWTRLPVGSFGVPWREKVIEKSEALSKEKEYINRFTFSGGAYGAGKVNDRFIRKVDALEGSYLIRYLKGNYQSGEIRQRDFQVILK